MGCGGGLFRIFDYYGFPRGCGGYREDSCDSYIRDDFDEKMTLLKRMYAEGIIDDRQFERYKQMIYDNAISFEELMDIRRRNLNKIKQQEQKRGTNSTDSDIDAKMQKLQQARLKVLQVKDKLRQRIDELKAERDKMENMAESVIKISEEKTEEFISKKIEIEESIQRLTKQDSELEKQIEEIDEMIKELQTKKLEYEAVKLKEEIENLK
ncbi:hypothetical protein SAMN02746089_02776 [Caldanaerobius fijiensis DSM 17918]|uniref:Uncharacterized protein n=1 Tax=Caldanaerobius fijiensis DSM 17918 TaxID=1121256 RepID=A0A1M5FLB4_9THEO|nr:hypothetical protein [Caldanaerobius fijiensis]SHF92296.1 hypothetical protein SAMN02746089_02776 [Caldanaerobius fijiensis DSM 17918]